MHGGESGPQKHIKATVLDDESCRAPPVPVLPRLKPRLVEKIVERLPVVEDLVAVVDDVRSGAHVPEQS